MIKNIFTIVLLFTSMLVAGDSLGYQVKPTASYNGFDSNSEMENTLLYGANITIHQNRYLSYRLGYEQAKNDLDNNKTLERLYGDVLLSKGDKKQFSPYLVLGAGRETIEDTKQVYVKAGVGFKYTLTEEIAFHIEAGEIKKLDTDDIDFTVSLGLGYTFGSTEKMPHVKESNRSKETLISLDKNITIRSVDDNKSEQVSSDKDTQTRDKRYYIQMAVWFGNINDEFLDHLRIKGFSYILEKSIRLGKDAQIVKVGPYMSRPDAELALIDLKKINENAYIANRVFKTEFSTPKVNHPKDEKYYVQMAVWFGATNHEFLNHLKFKGFPYTLEKSIRLGENVQIVKVGPYVHRNDAELALRDLKSINRDAYIKRSL